MNMDIHPPVIEVDEFPSDGTVEQDNDTETKCNRFSLWQFLFGKSESATERRLQQALRRIETLEQMNQDLADVNEALRNHVYLLGARAADVARSFGWQQEIPHKTGKQR